MVTLLIVIASPWITSTLVDDRRTAHSTFKVPFNVTHQGNSMCHIMYSSDEVTILKKCKVIVWDEATMSEKTHLIPRWGNFDQIISLEVGIYFLQRSFDKVCQLYPKELNGLLMNLMSRFKRSLLCCHVQLKQLTNSVRPLLQLVNLPLGFHKCSWKSVMD